MRYLIATFAAAILVGCTTPGSMQTDAAVDGSIEQCFVCEAYEYCDATTAYECVLDPDSEWQITIWAVGFTGTDLTWDPGSAPGSAPDVGSRIIMGSGTADVRDYFFEDYRLHTNNSTSFTEVIGASPIFAPYNFHARASELDGALWIFLDFDDGNTYEDIATCAIDLDEVILGGARNYFDCADPNTGHSVRVAWGLTEYMGAP